MRDKLEFLIPILMLVAAVLDLVAGIKNDEKYLIVAGVCFLIAAVGMLGGRISKYCAAKKAKSEEEKPDER